mmetsp:Transcript_5560/g.16545  ORF Transcript_5560/g.16545 Transcript_5560/m.16545 type:complete len:203 (-) Transcript_5560:83-691(-)
MARTTAGGSGAPLAYSFRTASARRSKRASSSNAVRAPPPRFSSAARVRDRSHAWSVATLTRPSPVTDRRGRASERVDEALFRCASSSRSMRLIARTVWSCSSRPRGHASGRTGRRSAWSSAPPPAAITASARSVRARFSSADGPARRASASVGFFFAAAGASALPPGLSRGSVLARRPYRMPPRFMMRRSRRTMGPSSHCSG